MGGCDALPRSVEKVEDGLGNGDEVVGGKTHEVTGPTVIVVSAVVVKLPRLLVGNSETEVQVIGGMVVDLVEKVKDVEVEAVRVVGLDLEEVH